MARYQNELQRFAHLDKVVAYVAVTSKYDSGMTDCQLCKTLQTIEMSKNVAVATAYIFQANIFPRPNDWTMSHHITSLPATPG